MTMVLNACRACGGAMAYDDLDEEWVCMQSGHRVSDREPADPAVDSAWSTNDSAPSHRVETFRIGVWVHNDRLTSRPDGGVRQIFAEMMIVKLGHTAKFDWEIQYLDTERMRFEGGVYARGRGYKPVLMERAVEMLREAGIDPATVKGWSKHFGQLAPR